MNYKRWGVIILQEERRAEIVRIINKSRVAKNQDLMDTFNSSIETIRRDLKYLEKSGLITRVYGGAMALNMYGEEPKYELRETKNLSEKKTIAKYAIDYIKDGDTLLIEVGTTTLEFSKLLGDKKDLTIITNSMPIAMNLIENPTFKVIFLGGNLRIGEYATSGSIAENTLDMFNVEKLIMGVGGIDKSGYITDYNIEESMLRRKMIKVSKSIIALADYSKFNVTALNRICEASQVTTLITDDKVPRGIYKNLEKKYGNIIIARG